MKELAVKPTPAVQLVLHPDSVVLYRVDTNREFNVLFMQPESALRYGRAQVYRRPVPEASDLVAELKAGKSVGWAYGFATIDIEPVVVPAAELARMTVY